MRQENETRNFPFLVSDLLESRRKTDLCIENINCRKSKSCFEKNIEDTFQMRISVDVLSDRAKNKAKWKSRIAAL